MIFPTLILILLVLVTLTLIILVAVGVLSAPPFSPTGFEAQVAKSASLQAGFQDPQPVACQDSSATSVCRGNCLLYETFTLETNIVDNLTPIANVQDPRLPDDFKCLDGHTMALRKEMSTCDQPMCVGRDGNMYTQGQTELFYAKCGQLQPCSKANRSAVVLNFQTNQGMDKFIRADAECVTSNTTDQITTFSVGTCPNSINLADNSLLNVVQQPIMGSKDTLVQIRAPLTGECLFTAEGQVGAVSCLNLDSGGFDWVDLKSGLEVPFFKMLSGTGRKYPPQLLLRTSDLPSIQERITKLNMDIVNVDKTLDKEFKKLSSSDQGQVLSLLNGFDINDAISKGEVNTLKGISAELAISPVFTKVLGPASDKISLIAELIEEIDKLSSLQVRNSELVVQKIGGCPENELMNPNRCPFPTQIVPAQAYNCT